MTELRDTVLEMDKEGNDEELAAALNKLQDFTLNHIVVNIIDENGLKKIEFGTGVFYLEQSYLRAAAKVMQEVSEMEVDDSNPNGNIYGIVSSVCRARALANGWNWDNPNYINCFIEVAGLDTKPFWFHNINRFCAKCCNFYTRSYLDCPRNNLNYFKKITKTS